MAAFLRYDRLFVAIGLLWMVAGGARAGTGQPFLIRLEPGVGAAAGRGAAVDSRQVLRQRLGLGAADDFRRVGTEADELGYVHERYQQYYRGVKVEHGLCTVHRRGGQIELLSGEVKQPQQLAVQPALTAAAARRQALAAVGARRYMWEDDGEERALRRQTGSRRATYFPTGELVIVDDYRQPAAWRKPVLAWKFNVYAQQPVSRAWVYVDARTGAVVLTNSIIKHANATGTLATRYLGARTGATDSFAGGYRLRETTRGGGINTYNCRRSTSYAAAVDFVDNDNDWTAAEHDNATDDNAALDAHYGAQATYDFWQTMGRNSYDGAGAAINSYVHYGSGFENAFWNGAGMTYGDGANIYWPLTSLDVCGHEIGHAVCDNTAGLIYHEESGALNEGFSDIWGACIEHFRDSTKQTWLIGEDVVQNDVALRSMENPNSQGQPDTYLGLRWFGGAGDNGGVHTNSGVLNFWFYLLSQGGTGTNDRGQAYAVTGINIHRAARLAYRAERLYMSPSTNYRAAVVATLQAAVDLYGEGSAAHMAVARAWYAVGLGEAVPTITNLTPASGLVGETVVIRGTWFTAAYRVAFNGTPSTRWVVEAANRIVAEVPVGATNGVVTVTTPSGTATSSIPFTVTSVGAAPVITAFDPAAGQHVGASVAISGRHLAGTTRVSFNGVPASGFGAVADTLLTVTLPSGATTGPLRVATPGGIATAPETFNVLPDVLSFTPTSGPPGTRVTVVGEGLTGATEVRFTDTTITAFTVESATRLTVVVPDGAVTGPIGVTTPSGSATSAASFTVLASPVPTLLTFTPTSGGPNTLVTLKGMGLLGATRVLFNGSPAAGYTVVSDTILTARVPLRATTGPISVTTPGGTTTSAAVFTVTAVIACRLAVSITPALAECLTPGEPVTLTSSVTGGALQEGYELHRIPYAPLATAGPNAALGDDAVRQGLPIGFAFEFFGHPYTTFNASSNGNIQFGAYADPNPQYDGAVPDVIEPNNFIALAWSDWNQGAGGSITYYTTGSAPTRKLVVSYVNVPHWGVGGARLTGQIILYEGSNAIDLVYTSTGTARPMMLAGVENSNGTLGLTIPGRNNNRNWNATTEAWRLTPGSVPGPVYYRWWGSVGATNVPSVTFTPVQATSIIQLNVADSLCDRTATATVTLAPNRPTVTGASRCGAGTVGLLAGGAPSGGSYRWYTDPSGGTRIAGVTTAAFITPPLTATTTYYVSTVSAGGCEAAERVGVSAIINEAPVVPTAVASPAAGAAGDSTILTISNPQPGVSYTWSGPGLPPNAAGPSVTATFPTDGPVTYTITATGVAGCGQPTTGSIMVNAPAVSGLLPTSGLVGTTVVISGANLTGATSVTFNGVSTAILGNTGTQLTVTVPPGALPGAVAVVLGSDTLRVPGTFCVEFAATATGADRCGVGAVTLRAAGAPAGGAYRWYAAATGGPALAGATGAALTTPTLTATTTYYVGIVADTSQATCEGPRTAAVATITAVPTVTLAATGPTTLCAGDSVQLTATGAGPGGAYRWSTGDTTAAITVSSAGTYSVVGTSAAGCAGAVDSLMVTLSPRPVPTVMALGPLTFCEGDSVRLLATGGTTYRWTTGDTTATVTVRVAGAYAVTATNAAGCTATSAPTSVVVEARPAPPTISQAAVGAGLVQLTSSAPTGNQWFLGGTPIGGATQATYTVSTGTQSGAYTVVTTSPAGCASAPAPAVSVLVTGGVAAVEAPAAWLVPNPVRAGQAVAVTVSGYPQPIPVSICNAVGQVVLTTTLPPAPGNTLVRHELRLGPVAGGVYLVRIGHLVRRLVVE